MARLRHGESVPHRQAECVLKDGRRVPVVLTYSPIRNDENNVIRVSVIARDISEAKRIEMALHSSEEHLNAILHAAGDAILTINGRGIIQSVNLATEKLFGYSAAEMLGQNVKMLMPPPYSDKHDGHLQRYLKTGEKHIIGVGREAEGRRKDGTVFPLDLSVSEVDDIGLFTGILRDITKR